jgi:PAS domain S-box-containing protein
MEQDSPPSAPADAFFRHVPQPICWLDAAFRLTATTHAFDALFPAAAALGAAFAAVERELPPRAGGATWDAFWQSVRQGNPGTLDVERHRTGEPAAELRILGTAYAWGGTSHTCLLFTDRTDSAHLRQETAQVVQRFRQIAQEFPMLIYGLDREYRVVLWNERCERVTGYRYGEIANDPRALDRLYPDSGRLRETLHGLSAPGADAGYEAPPVAHQFRHDRRIVSWLYRLNRSPLEDVHVWAVGIDQTEAYEATQALTQKEERFRAISQATNDVLWDWDLQTDLVWWGSGISHLFGHGMSQTVLHISWWVDHVHPDDRERVYARIREHIDRKEEFWLDEYRFRRGDNSYASVLDKGRLMLDGQGRPFRMVGGIRDVTDLKIALDKIQLRDRQLAEVSFYNSHKIRAPLARLMGLVQLLRMDPDAPPDEQRDLLEKIRSAAEELDYLVKNINHLLH